MVFFAPQGNKIIRKEGLLNSFGPFKMLDGGENQLWWDSVKKSIGEIGKWRPMIQNLLHDLTEWSSKSIKKV